VEYAQKYHVTIIPEQEAFGHLHKVLTWQQYAPLAEIPNGAVLAPGRPGSMQLITQWFDELAKLYPGPFLHIGADETSELGQGQTASDVQQRGLGAVYIDFLSGIHEALAPLHRRLLFWGDVAMNSPALVPRLPHDMIAVTWQYDPEPQGFHRWLDPYTKAGMETWVAPGVNNWNRVWPDFDLALRNIQGFVADGQNAGSTGMLNTIWDDDGEGLFLEDWYGVLFGAAASWQPGSADIAQFQRDYGAVFHGDATGDIDEAQRALIAAHQTLAGAGLGDARDAYFWIDPWSPEGQQIAAKIRPVSAEVRLDAERALTLIAQVKAAASLREMESLDAMDLGARRIDFLAFKFQTADQIADSYRRLYDGQKTPETVSYTHLDVYKRQIATRCANGSSIPICIHSAIAMTWRSAMGLRAFAPGYSAKKIRQSGRSSRNDHNRRGSQTSATRSSKHQLQRKRRIACSIFSAWMPAARRPSLFWATTAANWHACARARSRE